MSSKLKNNKAMVELEHVSKSFGSVKANKDISISFSSGVIKAILGENGAGKSTLMSILSGKIKPDSGSIFVKGHKFEFNSEKDALLAGIGMVYQHFTLIDSMTVAENVLLGQENSFVLNPLKMQEIVNDLAKEHGISINPSAEVRTLSMGEKQRVEILKLLYRKSTLLIFDEPTAVLTPKEAEQLFKALRHMASLGKSIVFISHKLQEVLDIADEISILRRGEIVDSFNISSVPDKDTLAAKMVGRSISLSINKSKVAISEDVIDVFELSDGKLKDISFTLKKGEILAIAGVAGNGQKELVEVLAGLRKPLFGKVSILGSLWDNYYPKTPEVGGVAYIPEDRQGVATCLNLSLVDNLLLTTREIFTDGLFLTRSAALAATLQLISKYDIRPGNPLSSARSLSGGNLQKLVVGRELLRQPSIILAENPTQGLDISATEEVWSQLLQARAYAGILLVTGDVTEALQLADRIAVMFEGKFVDCFDVSNLKKVSAIGSMMAGVSC